MEMWLVALGALFVLVAVMLPLVRVVRSGGRQVAVLPLVPEQPFRLELPPLTGGHYRLWLQLQTGYPEADPNEGNGIQVRPRVAMRVSTAGAVVLEGTFTRQGLGTFKSREFRSGGLCVTEDQKPLVDVPARVHAPMEVEGVLSVDAPLGFLGAALVATRHGRG